MKSHFEMFAAYNAWANTALYDAAAALPDEAYKRDVGAYFDSMQGTLNHILVGDRVWMKRFTGKGDLPDRLDVILYDGFDALRAARTAEDERICNWIESLEEADLEGSFSFRTIIQPTDITAKLSPALAHMFNHQTHHRGHAHMILSLLGEEPPPLDLIYFQRSEAGRRFI